MDHKPLPWPYCFYCRLPSCDPNTHLCKPCKRLRKPMFDKARTMVARAISAQKLPWVELMKCRDCGDSATIYDHRDYNKPLDVEPVCASCNSLRGPGLWDIDKPISKKSRLSERWIAETAKFKVVRVPLLVTDDGSGII